MATQDILINDGDSFISLSALAAEQVDAELPISSADDSVKLSSPEVNKYVINVGAADRITVGTSQVAFRDKLVFTEWSASGETTTKVTLDSQATFNISGKVFNIASNDSDLAEGDGGVYAYNRNGIYSVISNGIHFNSNAAGGVKSVSWKMSQDGSFESKTSSQAIHCGHYNGQATNSSNGIGVTDVVTISVDEETKVEVSSAAVKVRDEIWCNKFLPYAGAGAQLALDALATWTIDSKLLQIASNTSSVAGGTGLYIYNRTDDLAIVSNGIRFNSNAAGGVTSSYWVMETDGDFVAQTVSQGIKCTNYRGQGLNSDNGFTIDSSVKVTAGGSTKLNISDTSISAWPEYTPSAQKDLATVDYVDAKAGEASYDDTQIKADLASEASTRSDADTTLQNNINDLIWVGTQQEYDALGIYRDQTLYCITD